MPKSPSPRILSEREAAAYLGVGRTLFRARIKAGQFPAPMRQGRRVLWDKKTLDRYLDTLSGLNDNESANSWGDL
jgi:excisionase family DNA binding protein